MPKGKRKGKSTGGSPKPRTEIVGQASDEDSLNDNTSVTSGFSENRSVIEEGADEVDEQTKEDLFEEKLCEAIDGLNQKSSQGRTGSLESVARAFVRKCIPDFVIDRRITLTDSIEKSLKKGRGCEQAAAAQLAPLLCVQLGVFECAEEVYRDLVPVLCLVAVDKSVLIQTRSKCCWALGLCSFLAGCEIIDIHYYMNTLSSLFCASYLKGDGTIPIVSGESASLHAAALSAWSLLLTHMTNEDVYYSFSSDDTFSPKLDHLCELLDSAHLEVRMAAGETIALVYELGRGHNEDFQDDSTPQLVEKLHLLATDSHKYRAKKDRKTQRSSFRDILHYIEEGTPPNIQIRFGQESLQLKTWCSKKQYDAFCQVLGSGINLHLTENELVRDIFSLGERLSPSNIAIHRQSKLERHLGNSAAFKARTLTRSKHRDKRHFIMAC